MSVATIRSKRSNVDVIPAPCFQSPDRLYKYRASDWYIILNLIFTHKNELYHKIKTQLHTQ